MHVPHLLVLVVLALLVKGNDFMEYHINVIGGKSFKMSEQDLNQNGALNTFIGIVAYKADILGDDACVKSSENESWFGISDDRNIKMSVLGLTRQNNKVYVTQKRRFAVWDDKRKRYFKACMGTTAEQALQMMQKAKDHCLKGHDDHVLDDDHVLIPQDDRTALTAQYIPTLPAIVGPKNKQFIVEDTIREVFYSVCGGTTVRQAIQMLVKNMAVKQTGSVGYCLKDFYSDRVLDDDLVLVKNADQTPENIPHVRFLLRVNPFIVSMTINQTEQEVKYLGCVGTTVRQALQIIAMELNKKVQVDPAQYCLRPKNGYVMDEDHVLLKHGVQTPENIPQVELIARVSRFFVFVPNGERMQEIGYLGCTGTTVGQALKIMKKDPAVYRLGSVDGQNFLKNDSMFVVKDNVQAVNPVYLIPMVSTQMTLD